ncbi:MAG: hypothetical protein JXR48_00890 [Candidatus Delongbacteria bacterium]|nr:hypothetical protein [Candidatus Delongbacteria bacterium]MBN2833499.1 hypothetical protein [Candidatus Delongbacteria bacterium]
MQEIDKNSVGELIAGKTVFLVGNSKNAGKTTFLNYCLPKVRTITSPAYLTIGIDGENEDLIFGTPKPRIFAEKDDIIITTDAMLEKSDGLFEIIDIMPFQNVMGRIVLIKCLRPGFIEIVGAENNKQLSAVISKIETNGLNTIIVDGAANRQTQTASVSGGYFFYIMKITKQNFNSVIDNLRSLELINRLDEFNYDIDSFIDITGALTGDRVKRIEAESIVVINDFTKVFVDFVSLRKLSENCKLFIKNKMKPLSFVFNLQDITQAEIKDLLEKYNLNIPYMFNPYQNF